MPAHRKIRPGRIEQPALHQRARRDDGPRQHVARGRVRCPAAAGGRTPCASCGPGCRPGWGRRSVSKLAASWHRPAADRTWWRIRCVRHRPRARIQQEVEFADGVVAAARTCRPCATRRPGARNKRPSAFPRTGRGGYASLRRGRRRARRDRHRARPASARRLRRHRTERRDAAFPVRVVDVEQVGRVQQPGQRPHPRAPQVAPAALEQGLVSVSPVVHRAFLARHRSAQASALSAPRRSSSPGCKVATRFTCVRRVQRGAAARAGQRFRQRAAQQRIGGDLAQGQHGAAPVSASSRSR
jgi:hypothetical protein